MRSTAPILPFPAAPRPHAPAPTAPARDPGPLPQVPDLAASTAAAAPPVVAPRQRRTAASPMTGDVASRSRRPRCRSRVRAHEPEQAQSLAAMHDGVHRVAPAGSCQGGGRGEDGIGIGAVDLELLGLHGVGVEARPPEVDAVGEAPARLQPDRSPPKRGSRAHRSRPGVHDHAQENNSRARGQRSVRSPATR